MHTPVAAPECTTWVPVCYQFLEPFRTVVVHRDGRRVLTGYGIGETIQVMEPTLQLPICGRDVAELLLLDGSLITGIPPDIRLRRLWS